jgi:hypothetical protein
MKQIVFIIFLSLIFVLNFKAQDSEQISQLMPVHKPTKAELKKIDKLIKKSGWKDIVCVLTTDDDFLEIALGVENKILSNGKKVSIIKMRLNSNSLFFKETEKGESLASINIFGRIISTDEKINGRFEEGINFVLTKDQKSKLDFLPYQKMFELSEGKYKLSFVVRDTQTGFIGMKVVTFEVN